MILNKLRRWIVLLLATLVTCLGVIGWPAHSQAQSLPTPKLTLETAGLTLQELGSEVYGTSSLGEQSIPLP